jgi:flagellar hook-basal body complex protein FliE
MSDPIAALSSFAPLSPDRVSAKAGAPQANFFQSVNRALENVSALQSASSDQSQALIQGAPGASLEGAVIAAAHARIGWNATVAVRNEVVNAYRTIMNMPV